MDGVALGQVLLRVFPFYHVYHSTNTPYGSSPTCCFYQKNSRTMSGNFPKASAVSEIGNRCTENNFHVVFKELICTNMIKINFKGTRNPERTGAVQITESSGCVREACFLRFLRSALGFPFIFTCPVVFPLSN